MKKIAFTFVGALLRDQVTTMTNLLGYLFVVTHLYRVKSLFNSFPFMGEFSWPLYIKKTSQNYCYADLLSISKRILSS